VTLVYLVPQTSWAQSSEPLVESSADNDADAIVVTARRREESLTDVPISISAFSGKQLEAKNVLNIADLTKITPGLNISSGGSRSNTFVTIRGQSRGVTGNVSPGVVTYFNEIPLPTYGSMIQAYDMENIQVLKGPQGTLFGRNSIGGALLTYSAKPSYNLGGYVKADLAGYANKKFGGFKQLEGALNVPIIADVLAIRGAFQIGHDNGPSTTFTLSPYTLAPSTNLATIGTLSRPRYNFDEYSNRSYRLSVRFEPTDWLQNETVGDYSKIRGQANGQFDRYFPQGFSDPTLGSFPPALIFLPRSVIQANLTGSLGAAGAALYAQNVERLFQCGTSYLCDYRLFQQLSDQQKRTQYATVDPYASRTIIKGISNITRVSLSEEHTLKNIFGYRTTDSFTLSDNENSPLPVLDTSNQIRLKQITDELQLAGSLFAKKLTYTLGGFYYEESPNGRGGNQGLEVNAFAGLSRNMNVTYLTNRSKALYGQVDYAFDGLLKGLSVTAGARQTWDSARGCAATVTISPFYPGTVLVRDANSDLTPSQQDCEANQVSFPGQVTVNAQRLPKVTFKKLTYTLGLNWKITRDVLVYGVKRRGYRGGNYNTPLVDPYLESIQTFAPEVLDDYEVGAKTKWTIGEVRGTFNVAAFTGKDKGRQLQVSTTGVGGGVCIPEAVGSAGRASNCVTQARQVVYTPGTPGVLIRYPLVTTVANAGNLTIRGFEMDGSITPVTGFTLGGGLAYVDSKVDKIAFDPTFLTLLRAANLGVPRTIFVEQQPKWMANASVSINLPTKVLGGDLSFNADMKYSGRFLLGFAYVPAYANVDSRITLANIKDTGVDLSIWVRNALNTDYDYGTGASSPNSNGIRSYIQAPPRLLGVSLRYNFGS